MSCFLRLVPFLWSNSSFDPTKDSLRKGLSASEVFSCSSVDVPKALSIAVVLGVAVCVSNTIQSSSSLIGVNC